MVCQTSDRWVSCFSAAALIPQSCFSVNGKADFFQKESAGYAHGSQMTKLCSRIDSTDSMHFSAHFQMQEMQRS